MYLLPYLVVPLISARVTLISTRVSADCHPIQTGVRVQKRPNSGKMFDVCDLDLWPLTLTFCMDITFVSGNNSWKFHDDTLRGTWWKGCDRPMDGRTDRSVLRGCGRIFQHSISAITIIKVLIIGISNNKYDLMVVWSYEKFSIKTVYTCSMLFGLFTQSFVNDFIVRNVFVHVLYGCSSRIFLILFIINTTMLFK